jgi:O-antigen ligase
MVGLDWRPTLNVLLTCLAVSISIASPIPGLSALTHLILALLGAIMGVLFLEGRLEMRWDTLILLPWLLVCVAFASVLWASDHGVAWIGALVFLSSVLIYTTVAIALCNGASITAIIAGAVAGALVNGGIALRQVMTGQLVRAEGLTGNANALAIQLTFAAVMVLVALRRALWSRLVFAMVLLGVATAVSGSRKIFIAWMVVVWLIASMLLSQLLRSYRHLGFGALAVLIAIPVAVNVYEPVTERVAGLYSYQRLVRLFEGQDNSGRVRLAMIREGVELGIKAPIIGHGINNYRVVSSFGRYSHNNYIELFTGLGIIGVVLYYLMHLAIAGLALGGGNRGVAAIVMLLLMLDVAWVSYADKGRWLLLALLWWLVRQMPGRPVQNRLTS